MVESIFIEKLLKNLEEYFITKNNFVLRGETYDLILLIPIDISQTEKKYSLILSAQFFNLLHQKEAIKDLLTFMQANLSAQEYNKLYRINIRHSQEPLVQKAKLIFPFREPVREIIGDILRIDVQYALLIKSMVLDKLKQDNVAQLEILIENNRVEQINAGILSIDNNFNVKYFTNQGLYKMFRPDMPADEIEEANTLKQQSHEYLIQNKYMGVISLRNILRIF